MKVAIYLSLAHLRCHKGKFTLISLSLFCLIFLPIFVLNTLEFVQNHLRERAEETPLLLTPSRGEIESVLHHLHYQWETDPPSFTPSESFELFDSRPIDAVPLNLLYRLLSKDGTDRTPLLATSASYLQRRGLEIRDGRPPKFPGEVLLGHSIAKKWQVRLGDHLLTAPHKLLDLASAHQLELKVVGILELSGAPDDHIAITLQETAWIKMGLGHGHPDENLEGVPKPLHMSIHSEQEGYRRLDESNRKHIHFHEPKSLLPLTAMMLFPATEEERLFSLAWAKNHPKLQVIDPASVTERILASLNQLGELFLLLLTTVSLSSALLMLLIFKMSALMKKRDAVVLDELGYPKSVFISTVCLEWFFYLLTGTALSLLLMSIIGVEGAVMTEMLSLLRD